ncbi:MAG: hypothetical protein A3I14_12810 [Candidatus Rokubacteria bacterium RIFCSPLOWO2_02_FULL_73_56]|nr:MAG: hypothetical protein A3I14_12810 [Candidatus Rokubacteria bacterium RIFCSPLOWO2_02_FULL_73_56]
MHRTEHEAGREVAQASGTKEVAIVIGILLSVIAVTLVTYWVRSGGVEASAESGVVTAQITETPRPQAAAPAPAPAAPEVVHADVFFDFKSVRLRAEAVRVLQDKAALMDRAHTWAVLVQGHADRQGPAEYNKVLALRRADAVKQFLIELGVPENAVRVVTIGAEGALCEEATLECQQLNRRVHVEIRRLGRAAGRPVRAVLAHGDVLDAPAGR